MRYFTISYLLKSELGVSYGDVSVGDESFPTKRFIEYNALIQGDVDEGEVVVLNIHEFQGLEDFENFNNLNCE